MASVKISNSLKIHRQVLALCFVYMFLLAMREGYGYDRIGKRSKARVMKGLILAQFVVGTAYVVAVGFIEIGFGLETDAECHVAIRVCIAMYLLDGISPIPCRLVLIMRRYLFLLERVHIVGGPFIGRFRDPVWIVRVIVTLVGLGGRVGYECIAPRAELNHETGRCAIAIAPDAVIGVVTLDTLMAASLTAIFVGLLRPFLKSAAVQPQEGEDRRRASIMAIVGHKGKKAEASAKERLKVMIWRNVIGPSVVLANTLIN
ncbi:hypothetical protein CC80DRAFT_574409 [Byssothecium circinans]|uniref:Uncharacterized protein n=1 Tax=Byssothecium circinans TaxID=147558 RepID=A0A6A5UBT2_9PLEO|nr:hypothetical protein CC80DRAFT_574409 [Byssothecium circinans]